MTRRVRPWLWLLLLLPVALGVARLRFDIDVLNLLPTELPVVRGLQLYQRHFTDSRELIVTIRAATPESAETAARSIAETFRAQSNLVTSVIWQPIWMERPVEAAELIGFLWLNQPPSTFHDLAGHLTGTNIVSTLTEAREQLATSLSPLDLVRRSYDPYNLMALPENATGGAAASFGEGQNLFASADGTFRILFVKAKPDLSNYRICIDWLKTIKALVQSKRSRGEIPAEVAVGFTGGPAFVAEISGGMEHDMTSSVGLTSVIIALLFWFFHRRIIPMLWLLVLLAVILGCTLALGGLIFGAINVVSLGFAGILLGLAVDYGVVHYQEAMASPNAIIPEIRRAIGPSIFWAAVTTISAFLVLNLGGLPGLAQLGTLVALGVALSALVMLFAFLPPLFRDRIKKRQGQIAGGTFVAHDSTSEKPDSASGLRVAGVVALTVLFVLTSAAVLAFGFPKLDQTAGALRPRHSSAYIALDEIKTRLTENRDPLWLITSGTNETEIVGQFNRLQPLLEQAASNGIITSFTLPAMLWPNPENQSANLDAAREILSERNSLRSAALAHGFGTNSLLMTDAILRTWQSAVDHTGIFWPTNEMSRWVLEKASARTTNGFLAVGFIFLGQRIKPGSPSFDHFSADLQKHGWIVSGWDLLGTSILRRVQSNLWKVVLPMLALVLLSLWLAFRRPTEILLSIAVLMLSGVGLLTVMRLAGWSWNLLNLMALPLMLGSGVDYSIFMQLALRRHSGNLAASHHAVGRALLLCGGTAVAGFGSLSFSTNAGMASLGQVCAVGIAFNMLISVYLLPIWWRFAVSRKPNIEGREPGSGQSASTLDSRLSAPSSLYRPEFWRMGLGVVRILPRSLCVLTARLFAIIYWRLAPQRREIVIANLLPALNNDRPAATRKAKSLFQQFTIKIVDLWRYEAGLPIGKLLGDASGWEHFASAQATGRGVLLLTPHLGNWEFGGPWLTPRGVTLQVITLAEPGKDFTELRQSSRARWNIETLVIGNDPFAFLEIIRRLESGATVALLIDRPPPPTAVMVELFGKPFAASVAAAELARASGCVLLPVYLPRTNDAYAAHILPAVPYERATLRDRAARQQLTQQIVRAFEPAIRQHLDQWYHFVPVWPK